MNKKENNMKDLKLCFVKYGWAYFTSIPVTDQWGDDWENSPYEYNAGFPSAPRKGKHKDHKIVKVSFESDHIDPSFSEDDRSWSAEMINRGDVPWLRSPPWSETKLQDVPAGTTLTDFIKIVKDSGGEVYLPAGMQP